LLPWLCASALFMGIRTYYTDQAFQLAKTTRTPFLIMLASACVALPLSAFCIWHYGLNGAVYGMLAAAIIALALSWHLGQKAFPLPMPWKEIGLLGLATLAMAAVCWPFRHQSGWLWLFAAVSAGGFVYTAFVLLFNLAGLRSKLIRKLRRQKAAS
jgi:peptidoglycan biosynthesis protein MviN/MurJ (putative lipid II flippase)